MTSVLRCSRCGFDASPEHFKDDLCTMCAEGLPKRESALIKEQKRPFGPIVACRCGCGAKFHQFDKKGRIRYSLAGHYKRLKRRGKYAS